MTQARSLWEATLPAGERVTAEPLDGDTSVDVCVVGAGLTGLWSAYHLLRTDPSLRVLVLEAGHVGFGASGRNGGWCSALFPLSTAALERRHGLPAALAMRRMLVRGVQDVRRLTQAESIACDWAGGGTVVLARSPAQLAHAAAEATEAARYGVDEVRLLDAADVAEHVRADGVLGGTWTPDCARVHPARLVHGLARAVQRRGGRIVAGTRATRIGVGEVQTTRGRVRCGVTVRATEAYTPLLDGRRSVVPVYSLVISTAPLPQHVWDRIGLARGQTFSEHRHLVVYGQRTADDRMVFGGRGAPYHWGSAVSPRFDTDPRVHAALADLLLDLFPPLRPRRCGGLLDGALPIEFAWGGPLGISRDWHPTVGFDRARGTAWAGGYVGDGVALSQLAGATVADLVTGAETERTALPWVGHASPPWEPEPLRWAGVNAGLRLAVAADARERRTGRPSRLGAVLSSLTGG
ncbi:MAG TPA: FAD-dependent oxidoreductase [Mycobacteriales bacterium]|nr:FAD-dependent oxidoreductase [Mycobacteriales bacterium]